MTGKSEGIIQTWSTRLVSPEQRLDYWIGAVCEGFLEMEVTSPARSDFHCSLDRGQLDTIGINRVDGRAQHVYRTDAGIARSPSNFYYLLGTMSSEWAVVQHGRSERMQPADLVLVDSRRRYEFHFPVKVDCVSIELPTAWVESWLDAPEICIGRRIDATSGWGRALSAFAFQLSPQLAIDRPLPAQVFIDQLGALLALALGREGPTSGSEHRGQATLRDRICRIIRLRYAEPGLTAALVARDLDISERTLHRALHGGALTFGGILNECRMTAARRMLTQQRFDHISVGGIGLRVGLSDPSHFIRQCRKYLGTTPGEMRRQR